MPGLKAMHERFGTKPWADLCQPAIHWAELRGTPSTPSSSWCWRNPTSTSSTPSRAANTSPPTASCRRSASVWPKPELRCVLRRLAEEGPDYFITGGWAEHFVERANQLGWEITLDHMTAIPPRWGEPLRFTHSGHEIVQWHHRSGKASSPRW